MANKVKHVRCCRTDTVATRMTVTLLIEVIPVVVDDSNTRNDDASPSTQLYCQIMIEVREPYRGISRL